MNLKIILLLLVVMLCNLAPTVSAAIVSPTSNTTENLTDAYADGYTLAGRYNDEFNQGVLDTSRWTWIRENASAWWMSSWYLGMNITNTSLFQNTNTSPLLLQDYGGEDITIISKQWFNPTTSAESAGIIIYADDDNFVDAQYYISGSTKKVIIQKEDDNVGNYTTATVNLSQPHYIKLVKSGTNYSLYYSTDKKTWVYTASVTQPDAMTKIGYVTGGAPSNHPVYYDAFVTDNFTTTGSLISVFDAGFGGVINSTLFMYTNASDSHVDGYASKDNITWTLLQTDMPTNTDYTIPPDIQNRTVYVRAVLRGTNTSTPVLQPITAQSQISLIPPRSDDFNSLTLNTTLWEIIDPTGDSKFTMEGNNTANAFLNITVPCCVTHAPSTTNNAPRIMQEISNVDFEIEAKFQSLVTEQYQEEGFIIEESPGNYIRIDFNGGTSLNSYAGIFLNNKGTTKYNAPIHSEFSQPVPLYLKVNRSGDNWSYRYSFNGITWTNVTNFTYNLNVSKVGLFIGNENTNSSLTPKFTGNIDYFFNTASPITPEDIPDTTPPVINVWYGLDQRFGHLGTPQTWINILGNVSDSSSAVVALNYSLNDGPVHQLVLGKDNLRLEYTNDFNIEEGYTNFTCVSNHIDLSANDSAGNVNNTRVNISYTCGIDWPMPYIVDWSTVSDIQDVAQVVDGQWIISNGKVTPTPLGYDRIIAMGNMTWKNYTVTVPITLNSAMTIPGANFGIALRWKEHVFWPDRNNGAYPREGWYPLGAIAGYFNSTVLGGKRLALLGNNMNYFANDTTAMQLVAGSTYNFKASAQTVGTDQVFSLKVWEQGAGEPANWTVRGNAPAGALTQGSILLLSYNSDVSFGDVNITNLDTPANIPPSSDPNGPYTGTEGTAISFDGSKSSDPDGNIVSYEWNFGDGNFSNDMNSTHTYSLNGTYTVSLKVTDNDGLNATNSTTAAITVTSDVTAPSGVTGLTNITYKQNYINWTWSDPAEPDFDHVEVYLNGSFQSNVTKGIQFYNATGLAYDTIYMIGLKSVDTSGNVNSSMVTDVASTASLPDTTPPVWLPIPSNQTLELGTAFDYTVAATDPLSVTYSVNDTVNFEINSISGHITNATALSKGVYGLNVTARDASGNENPVSITVTVSDNIAPAWNPDPSDQIIQVGTSFSYSVNADDQSVITYKINNTNFEINSGTGLITNKTALNAGAYGLNITATDDSGNSISRIITVTVQAESTYSASGYVFDNNNAALADVSIQNGSYQAISSGTGYYEITGLLNGSYNFSYTKAEFNTGYSIITISGSDINEDKTILDTTPPARVTGLLNDTPTRMTVNLSWNPTDGASFYQIFRDSAIVGATQNTYWNDTGLSNDTVYQYQVKANDSYNNWGSNSTILSVKTAPASDNMPPARVTNLMDVSYGLNNINWTWSVPAERDFDHVEVYLNSSFQSNVTKGKRFYNATDLTSDTSYTIGLKSVDTSGNVNSSMVNHSTRTARNTVTSFVNLIGNNNSEPIVLENQAEIDITANNSSVSGNITLTADTNITRLNGSVSIANSTFGIQTAEKALNRYVEVDSTGINKSNISSVNLTMFYSDVDISGFDENSLKVYWWNGSIWKPLDPKGRNYSNENGPIVIDIRRNLTANKLTVQLNHFSTFALVGTPSTTLTPPCNNCNSGSGGGGGGGGASGENYSNIELTEKYDMQISKDALTSYRFTHEKNPIMFVNITGNTSYGIITVSEEVLKGTSTLVRTSPEGLVYKNVNIWVGASGFATPKNIKEAYIKFSVDNNWISANNVTSSDIILVKWNGDSWIQLETRVLSKDDTSTFFEGKTNAFSPFAITVKMGGVTAKLPDLEIPQQVEAKAPDRDEKSSQPAETAIITRIASSSGISIWPIILIILIINIIVVVIYFKWVKK
ncbi:Uncharacterised protein [uncultured archaeon]|nr:Uncharacterised protein [uncultured archaeon]